MTEAEMNVWGRTKEDKAGYIEFNFPAETGDKSVDYFPNTFFDCYFEWKADWESEKKKVKGETPGKNTASDW